jgi:hypothetical protein
VITRQHAAWSERYEALRSEALSGNRAVAGARGLILFLRQGLAAWMETWQRMVPASAPVVPLSSPQKASVPSNLPRQIANILADLVIRTRGGKAL